MVEIADLGDVVEIVVGREYSRAVHNRIPRDQDVERTGRTHKPRVPKGTLDIQDERLIGSMFERKA